MKKRISMLVTAALLGVSIFATTVGATVVDISENAIEQTEVKAAEDVATFTPDEYEREMSATSVFAPYVSDGINTEASANKILFMGDSTACGDTSFVSYFPKYYPNVEINNVAVGGATYSSTTSNSIFDQMKKVDVKNYDTVVLLFGVNDFYLSRDIGSSRSYDSRTVGGALNQVLTKLRAANIKTFVILPFPCEPQFTNKTNTNGYRYLYYVDIIKSVANQYYNVTTVDFTNGLGVTADNFGAYFVDNCHPNPALSELAAKYLSDRVAENSTVDKGDVYSFVLRLYDNCLGRPGDTDGVKNWAKILIDKKQTGVQVADGFFFSNEFIAQKHSDEEFVSLLYKTLMDREADTDGKAFWVEALASGVSRKAVFKGFAESKEFTSICTSYGITRGNAEVSKDGKDRNVGCTIFVARLYTKALGRGYDTDGLNYWCNQILDGKVTVRDASTNGFFHSQEFLNKKTTNEEYVKTLYRTFLGREAEESGLHYWLDKLNSGTSRDDVLNGFADSVEFAKIRAKYGM